MLAKSSEQKQTCQYIGVGDKPMPCKAGATGPIPGFSIKPLSVSLQVFPS